MPKKKISLKNTTEKNVDLLLLFDDYVKEKRVASSAATVKGLKYKIVPFIEWMQENNYSVTQSNVNEYVIYLNSKYENKVTITSYLRHVRCFCNWLHDNEYGPKIKITIKKEYEVTKDVYTDPELKLLLVKPSSNNFNELRNWATINFFLGTGCRINTLINVKIKDVDFDTDTILLRVTKNGKQQLLPLCSSLKKALKSYLRVWNNEPNDYLFPNQYGEQMSNVSVTHAINKYNKSRSVEKTSCHLFRHTFAHNYLLNGGDIFRLQQILGHSTLEMVKIYANMNNIHSLKQNFNDLNTLDNISASKQTIKCK